MASWRPASDLRRQPGTDGGGQADVPGLQLASHREVRCIAQLVPGALPAQPALPHPDSWPGHGGSGHESCVYDPGPRSGTCPLAAGHRDAAQAVHHSRTGDGGRP